MEAAEAGKNQLDSFIVGSVPTLFYIPDFITNKEEELLLNTV